MRSKMLPSALLILTVLFIIISLLPSPVKAITYDPYEIPPGAPRWFSLQDFNEKGDRIELQVVFKLTSDGNFQERPIDVLILESSRARRNPSIDGAREHAIYIKEDVGTRLEVVIENTMNAEMSIIFYNEQQDGDLENWDNATVKIRVDYEVFNAEKNDSNILLVIILVLLIVVTIAMLIGIGFYFLKRRMKDARSFFNPEAGLYYVFRDIDGSIMYFTAEQYTDLYNSHGLVTYEYLGQAMKKGGPVMTPVDELQEQDIASLPAQPMGNLPLGVSEPLPYPQGMAPADQLPLVDSQMEAPPFQESYFPEAGQPLEPAPMEEPSGPEGTVEGSEPDAVSQDMEEASPDVLDELVEHAHTSTDEGPDELLANIGGEDGGNENIDD